MELLGLLSLSLVGLFLALMLLRTKADHGLPAGQGALAEADGAVTIRFGPQPSDAPIEIDQKPTGTGKFYVYVHRDPSGQIFYVGKGTRRRAWSDERHPVWHKYVDERCGGTYTVQIVSYHETGDEAEEAESRLISRYGKQLVNWINTERQFDYPALERFHAARNANRFFVANTKPLESTNIEEAIKRYKQAMLTMYEYESIPLERGLIAELSSDSFQCGSGGINILDRLTLCLYRVGRRQELNDAVDDFLTRFPQAARLAMMQPVLKRRARAMRSIADLKTE